MQEFLHQVHMKFDFEVNIIQKDNTLIQLVKLIKIALSRHDFFYNDLLHELEQLVIPHQNDFLLVYQLSLIHI